jgi:L-alanine-DL-glutamate epimerase-like enolase superfamily enzyme
MRAMAKPRTVSRRGDRGYATGAARGLDRAALQALMPAGAARNALDCACWDLAAKQAGRRVHDLAGLAAPSPLITAYTIIACFTSGHDRSRQTGSIATVT